MIQVWEIATGHLKRRSIRLMMALFREVL